MTYISHMEYMKAHINKIDLYGYPKNPKANPYTGLANLFYKLGNSLDITEDDKYADIEVDKRFYYWLQEYFINKNSGSNSSSNYYVLNFLLENEFNNSSIDVMKEFVFNPCIFVYNNDKKKKEIKISQKWHFYISWYALKEFYGKEGINLHRAIKDDEWGNKPKPSWVFENYEKRNIELNKWLLQEKKERIEKAKQVPEQY